MSYDFTTSYPAYKEKGKDYCRRIVLVAIEKLGICNDREISDYLGWPINRITPRRLELVEQGKVHPFQKQVDPKTNRLVNYWKKTEKNHMKTLFE